MAEPDPLSATIIQLPRSADHEQELLDHARFLQTRYGERWHDLPDWLGKPLARAEVLLASCPIATSSDESPVAAIEHARAAARVATAIGDLVQREGGVLGEALSSDLVDLPLDRLAAVAEAVLALGTAPRAEPWWASPTAAHAAAVVLEVHGDDLRASAQAHEAVYAQFTERIWDIPERRLRRGRHPWRLISRIRLRHDLAATSRTLRAPRAIGPAANLVLEARDTRARLESIATLLASHLGEHHRGPLTDVDTALVSLAAVRRFHDALGEQLDAARFARLLDADAFAHEAIVEPATSLHTALQAWRTHVGELGGSIAFA
jgi:hypothetical protein